MPQFRVTGGLGTEVAEALQIFHFEADSRIVQLDVLQERGVARGKNEPVAANPLRITGIKPKVTLIDQVSGCREGDWGTRVSGTRILYGISSQCFGQLHSPIITFVPVQRHSDTTFFE